MINAGLTIQLFDPFTDQTSFVRKATVRVSKGTPPSVVPTKLMEPHRAFCDFNVDTQSLRVEVTLTVPFPTNSLPPGATAIAPLVITQAFELREDKGDLEVAIPGDFHPRVDFRIDSSARRVLLSFDVRFIDLTALLRITKPTMFSMYDRDFGTLELEPGRIHHGCELRILELMTNKPKTWLVLIPPQAKIASRRTHNILLFFRPAFMGYKNTESLDDNAVKFTIAGHFRSEPKCAPFYWWGCDPAGQGPTFHLPNAGWERQLAVSEKPVILVEPLPHSEDFGKVTESDLKFLLAALIDALAGDATLPSGTLGKIGILGLSRGGSYMFKALEKNKLSIDEVYLFDPSERLTPVSKHTKLITDWFLKANHDQKLRMVAGYGLSEMQTLEKAVSSRSGDVSVIPKKFDFFNTPGNLYHQAVIPHGASVADEILAVPTGTSKLSTDTNIYLENYDDKEDRTTLTLKGTTIKGTYTATPIELAGIVRANWFRLKPPKRKPARTLGELNEFLSSSGIQALGKELGDGHWIRHLWASAGGTGNPKRDPAGTQGDPPDGQKFEGHLLFCLKNSGFY